MKILGDAGNYEESDVTAKTLEERVTKELMKIKTLKQSLPTDLYKGLFPKDTRLPEFYKKKCSVATGSRSIRWTCIWFIPPAGENLAPTPAIRTCSYWKHASSNAVLEEGLSKPESAREHDPCKFRCCGTISVNSDSRWNRGGYGEVGRAQGRH